MKYFSFGALLWLLLFAACQSTEPADLVLRNGNFYTVDADQPQAQAVAVRNGRIVFVGSDQGVLAYVAAPTQVIDLQGQTVTPGLIEGHAHLMGLGQFQRNLDLTGVKSYQELVDQVAQAVAETPEGQWIVGRGWHQSKWTPQPSPMVTGFQTHEALSEVSPRHPVYLKHASGHAAFANARAMAIAGIDRDTRVGGNGEIIRYPTGEATGIFTEVAARLIEQHIPTKDSVQLALDLQAAIDACLRHGITSFHDAGVNQRTIDLYQRFDQAGKLPLRLHVMLTGSDEALLENWYQRGPLLGDHLTVRAIKLYADGALGSRGAWLLEPYSDRPDHVGNPIMPVSAIQRIANAGLEHGFQVCTHAIGDRANREVLNAYEAAQANHPDSAADARFRIEHAQHLHPADIPRFAELGVIPAMQAIHMASDRPWAIDRLGEERIVTGAYVWHSLLETGVPIVNGTDAPVEPVDPIPCFYASVTRQTLAGRPPGGYEAAQKMTRPQALRSYTLDAAYGAFMEDRIGSIEVGKQADFTVFDRDLMTVPEEELLGTQVTMTINNGQVLYQRPE
jgi:predicted amidohydrolase YtcJ